MTSLQITYTLLKNIYLPLVQKYLNQVLTADQLEDQYSEAFRQHSDGVGGDVPYDITTVISNVFWDLDEYWEEYPLGSPEYESYFKRHEGFAIDKAELDRRCRINYETMLQMLAKYADQI